MKLNAFVRAGLLGSLLLITSAVAGNAQASRMDRAVGEVVDAIDGLTDIVRMIETVKDIERYRKDILDVGRRMAELQEKYRDLQENDRSQEEINEEYPELQKSLNDLMKAMIDLGLKSPEVSEKLGQLIEEAMPPEDAPDSWE